MKPLAILLLLGVSVGADDILPQPFAKERYSLTLGKSPFALEAAPIQQPPPPPPPPENITLRGVSTVNGKSYVLLQRSGESRTMEPLIGGDTGKDGLAVQSVRLGSSFRDTVVVIRGGTQTRELRFNPETVKGAPPVVRPPQLLSVPDSAGPQRVTGNRR